MRASWSALAIGTGPIFLLPLSRELGRFLGDVDAHRAPGDAPAAANAARSAELIVPGAQLVGDPLAIAAGTRSPDTAAMQIGVVELEARRPVFPPLRVLAGEVAGVLGGRAVASRAHHRAVAAGQAPVGDLVP